MPPSPVLAVLAPVPGSSRSCCRHPSRADRAQLARRGRAAARGARRAGAGRRRDRGGAGAAAAGVGLHAPRARAPRGKAAAVPGARGLVLRCVTRGAGGRPGARATRARSGARWSGCCAPRASRSSTACWLSCSPPRRHPAQRFGPTRRCGTLPTRWVARAARDAARTTARDAPRRRVARDAPHGAGGRRRTSRRCGRCWTSWRRATLRGTRPARSRRAAVRCSPAAGPGARGQR